MKGCGGWGKLIQGMMGYKWNWKYIENEEQELEESKARREDVNSAVKNTQTRES